jgi:hypothetical protein
VSSGTGDPEDLTPAQAVEVGNKCGITFLFAQAFHPALRFVGPARKEIGIPTVFNILGPLANPARPKAQVVGVANAAVAPMMAQVLSNRGTRALVVRGDDGLDELSTATTSTIWSVLGEDVVEMIFNPRDLGISIPTQDALLGGDAAFNADVALELFGGNTSGNYEHIRNAVCLNAAAALVAAQTVPAPRVDCMEVHRISATFKDKLPLIAVVIREDIGAGPPHASFIEHLDATVGKYVSESPLFESKKKPNSSEVRTRELWINDYEKVKARLNTALISIPPHLVQLLGDILEFVFKHGLEECYVPNYLYDTAHAYEGEGRANESSCPTGATERVYTTLFNCIKGMNRGVFGELNRILVGEQGTSWEELDKASKIAYQREFDSFVLEWAQANLENGGVQAMTPVQRNEAVLAAFKAREGAPPLPPMVEGFIRRDLFRGLTILWPDFGFNSENAGNAGGGGGGGGSQGGRRTRHKKRRNRKTHRKNKKSMKRRH